MREWWDVPGHRVPRTPHQVWTETQESWERSRQLEVPGPSAGCSGPARWAQGGLPHLPRESPCGGQGVYTRHLTRELVRLGHSVEVFAGPPWPELDDGVGFTPVPGLDLYRQPDPFRIPHPGELRTTEDWLEFGIMCSAGFGEPSPSRAASDVC